MANLRPGAQVPAALESAILAIAEVASYLDSYVSNGMTTNQMKNVSRKAVKELGKTMSDLRKAHTKYGEE